MSHDCDPDRETAAVFAFEWRTPVPQPTATATGNRPFAHASVLSCPSLQTGSVSDYIGRGTMIHPPNDTTRTHRRCTMGGTIDGAQRRGDSGDVPAARRTGDECGSPSPSSSSQSSSSRREARRRAMSALAMATAMLPAASSRPVGDPRCNVLAFPQVPVRGARGARRDLTRTATTPGARARTLPHWDGRGRVTASQTTEEREGETDVAWPAWRAS